MGGVTNRVALVTGAGSPNGIGFATARLLRDAGARVAITSTTDRIHERCDELGGTGGGVFASPADLADADAAANLHARIEKALGPIEILVNNAGMVQIGRDEPSAPLHEVTDEKWRYGIDISLTSAFLMTRAVLPSMMQCEYGRIVHISSVTGPVAGIPGSTVYGTAKAGMLGMARSLAIEVGSKNVTVNCVGPGWIHTESSGEGEITAGKFTPVGRSGTPEEVGHVAVFLASEEASYVTGQFIVVDGGNTIQEYKVAL
ncbi:MAG: SDR family oxidoreductase [Arenicellales bacterium]|jgi:3-oxoacyl-[acyl-carrier protein] reductase|nr:SDR family oxidoreductase [Arenicellales bacterium]MDP6550938.1 SDR family oxidoreductase [Arenicellales bacterium]MDP6790686.1 SDR family oxidoreductase [Arenicellales bacterium]MDP6917972.1 SDR family oxidoreductase [Arenicellales bacterium]|tara:strand:+ start:7181 stop:7957 length:777 start_codon:yes stop_codon:yes gene_type:complete